MGRDKALLPHPEGGCWLERSLRLLGQLELPISVLSGHPAHRELVRRLAAETDQIPPAVGLQAEIEPPPWEGPLLALARLAQLHPQEHLLLCPVDMPFLALEDLQQLLRAAAAEPQRIPVAHDGERWQPLLLVLPLEPSIRADLHAAVERGDRRLQGWLAGQPCRPVPLDHQRLRNVNRPQDWPAPLRIPPREIRRGRLEPAVGRAAPDPEAMPSPVAAADSPRLSHLDAHGAVQMVDVSERPVTVRHALAEGLLTMAPQTLELVLAGQVVKGDVLAVARVAAIQAAKRTSDLIPLCHPLPLSGVQVRITPEPDGCGLRLQVRARTTATTGVEMEALTAVQVGLLTLYDMLKSADPAMVIGSVRLLAKDGGRHGAWRHPGWTPQPGLDPDWAAALPGEAMAGEASPEQADQPAAAGSIQAAIPPDGHPGEGLSGAEAGSACRTPHQGGSHG